MELSEKEKRKLERERITRERIQRELRGEPTGFDILLGNKKKNITVVCQLLQKYPDTTRHEITKALGISMRTASRYLAEAYIILRKKGFIPLAERQLLGKEERIKRINEIREEFPNLSEKEIAGMVGISPRTLYAYKKVKTKTSV